MYSKWTIVISVLTTDIREKSNRNPVFIMTLLSSLLTDVSFVMLSC